MIGKLLAGIVLGAGIGALLGYFGKCSSGTCPLTANPYRGALYGAAMGVVLALAFSHAPKAQLQKSSPREPAEEAVAGSGKEALLHVDSEADFKALVLDAGGICLVGLFSNRCPPCRVLAPTIVSLADKYAGKVTVCKVDVDRLPTVAEQYGITAIPTVLVMKDGKEVERLVGLRRETEYVTVLDKLLEGRTR